MGQNSSLTFGPCWRASYLSPCLNYRSSIKLPLIERCTHSFGPMAPTSILRRCTIGRTTSMRWRRAHEIGNFSPPDAQGTGAGVHGGRGQLLTLDRPNVWQAGSLKCQMSRVGPDSPPDSGRGPGSTLGAGVNS